MDRETLQATVHGVAESDITEQLHFTFFQKLEKNPNDQPQMNKNE